MKRRRYAEAAEIAREYLKNEPQGAVAQEARVVLCMARLEGGLVWWPAIWSSKKVEDRVLELSRRQPLSSIISRPWKLFGPVPQYTGEARKMGLEGEVVLEAIIDSEGCVRNVRVLQSLNHELDQLAMESVKKWVFQPAMFRDEPFTIHYTLTINFENSMKKLDKKR